MKVKWLMTLLWDIVVGPELEPGMGTSSAAGCPSSAIGVASACADGASPGGCET